MERNILIVAGVLVVLLVIVVIAIGFQIGSPNAPIVGQVTPNTPNTGGVGTPNTGGSGGSSMGTSTPQNNSQTQVITYNGSSFSPSVLTIPAGTTVIFQNQSTVPFHPASDPHPLHNGYPTTGGCVSSTFDACASVPPGSSWSFKFDIRGTWGYHNHLNPGQRGTIVVQ